MIDTLALDSSAAIDLFSDRPPEIVKTALHIVLPLPVVGELRFGAMNAAPEWRTGLLERLDQMIDEFEVIAADLATTISDATVRLQIGFPKNMSRRRESSLLNDLWIAAICLQHDLPLVSNDHDFDRVEGLRVIHW